MVCTVLNDLASDPYRSESNGGDKMTTYFNPDMLNMAMSILQMALMLPLLKFGVDIDVNGVDVETRSFGF